MFLYLLDTLQHPNIWHKRNGGAKTLSPKHHHQRWGPAQWFSRNESLETIHSQRRQWCCRDCSSPPPFAQRTSFCTALCDSAGCKSISCCSLCRCQLGCLCCSLGFSLDILSDLVSGELGTGFSVSVAGTNARRSCRRLFCREGRWNLLRSFFLSVEAVQVDPAKINWAVFSV